MNEFALIERYFKSIKNRREDIVIGIGDDAACLSIPSGHQLLVSSDSLLCDVHFRTTWDAYDIAYRAVMVNISDIAAMGGESTWVSLSLSLPELNESWLQRFSQGLNAALTNFNIALIGGDTNRGPMNITLTIHGLVEKGKAIRRTGAKNGDKIFSSGNLGGAALAIARLDSPVVDVHDKKVLMEKLLRPRPRVDLRESLLEFASSAIDISDGLSADLNHICEASQVGACLFLDKIPCHPLLLKHQGSQAIEFALNGGDDYELCFTVSNEKYERFMEHIVRLDLQCTLIGEIESELGIRGKDSQGQLKPINIRGYRHF